MDVDEAIAAACRGSGNPASLAWLAEGLGITSGSRVVDLGSGLGGPAAWIARRYRAVVVAVEPAAGAATGAARVFPTPVVRAAADAAPLRSDAFAVALVLGVLSVVAAPVTLAAEAARIAGRVGVLEYCSTAAGPRTFGGSHFPTPDGLDAWLVAGGLTVVQRVAQPVPAPAVWQWAEAVHDATPADSAAEAAESEVVAAVERGDLVPHLVLAERRHRG